jgi:hypothetical protein
MFLKKIHIINEKLSEDEESNSFEISDVGLKKPLPKSEDDFMQIEK